MLKDPRLEVFYTPPKTDLRLNYDIEMKQEQEDDDNVTPWPDTSKI